MTLIHECDVDDHINDTTTDLPIQHAPKREKCEARADTDGLHGGLKLPAASHCTPGTASATADGSREEYQRPLKELMMVSSRLKEGVAD